MRVGILGGGQLGRMIALAGYSLGVRCTVLEPAENPSAGQVCGHIAGEFEDFISLYKLAQVSVIAVRGRDGSVVTYPLIENQHQDGILHRSVAPAGDTGEELTERAAEYATRVLSELGYVGVLTIEWFQDGPRLLANEMAPRV